MMMTLSLFAAAGCGNEPLDYLVDSYVDNGVTCENAEAFSALGESDQQYVMDSVLSAVTDDLDSFKQRGNCEESERFGLESEVVPDLLPGLVDDLRPLHAGGPGTWRGAANPETGTGGSYPFGIYRDSLAAEWMCNSGVAATAVDPADFIGVTYVSGSYASTGTVKVKGKNIWANVYLSNTTNASRVYSDNHVAMCIGYWSVFFSGAIIPLTTDFQTQK
jgi:hypothetical protein